MGGNSHPPHQSLVEDTVTIPVAGPGKYPCRGELHCQDASPLSKGSAAGLGMSLLDLPGPETELDEPEMKGEILDQVQ